jgi:hypothetical protein
LDVLAADNKARPPSMQIVMTPLVVDSVNAVVSEQGALAIQVPPVPAGDA